MFPTDSFHLLWIVQSNSKFQHIMNFLFSFTLNFLPKALLLCSSDTEISQAARPNLRPDLQPCNQLPQLWSIIYINHVFKNSYGKRGWRTVRETINGKQHWKQWNQKRKWRGNKDGVRETEADVVERRKRERSSSNSTRLGALAEIYK